MKDTNKSKQYTENRLQKLEHTIKLLEEQVSMLGQLNSFIKDVKITRTDEVWNFVPIIIQ